MILDIIQALEQATKLPVKLYGTEKIENCICYKYIPLSSNGCVGQNRLELRLITKQYADIARLSAVIKNTLLNIGDTQKFDGVLSVLFSGGGQIRDEDTNTYHQIFYFTVKEREV